MILRRFVAPVLAATVLVAACKKAPPPPAAVPTGPSEEELARARADSIAAARAAAEEAARQRAAAEAAAARERAVAAARTTLEQMVFFDYDKSDIRDDAAAVLRGKVDILRASPQVQIQIQGHADERGSTEYNLALGDNRANAAKQLLVQLGIGADRIRTISYGKEKPFCTESNEQCYQQNRRAHFAFQR
jgi:peptidoglycan-associated lipoprotein